MKRLWIGVGLLVILLAMGLSILFISLHFHRAFSQSLEQAGYAALRGDWAGAEKQAAQSKEQWERYQHFWAAFTDHEPMEQMQNLFSQLALSQDRRLAVEFASACLALVNLSEAIDESHGLHWWSVL